MNKPLLIAGAAGLAVVAWLGFSQFNAPAPQAPADSAPVAQTEAVPQIPAAAASDQTAAGPATAPAATAAFKCDKRLRCPEMTSCAEATFFIQNCPNTRDKMDGNNDGIPCERQWCK